MGGGADDTRVICAICQDHVSSVPAENTCHLCGHVFHLECVNRLREVSIQQGRHLPANYCPEDQVSRQNPDY